MLVFALNDAPAASSRANAFDLNLTQTANVNGSFAPYGVPAGTYILGVKGSKWLQKDVGIDTTDGRDRGQVGRLPSSARRGG